MQKRKDGRYQKKVTLPNGKTKHFYSVAKNEREAEKDFNKQLLLFEQQNTNKRRFSAVAEEWNKAYREKNPEISYNKNIKAPYERTLDYFSNVSDIEEITASDVNAYVNYLIIRSYSKKSIATHKSVLSMILNYAIIKGYVKYNVANDIRLPNNLPKKKRDLPSTETLKEINKHTEGFDLLPYFILNTGCRCSEALAIRKESIDFENNLIKIRNHVIHNGNKPVFEPVLKTESAQRDIILLERVKEAIPKNFKGFLFSMNGDGKEPLTKSALAKRWTAYLKKYNLEHTTAHQLRHAFATMLFEAQVDLKDAQELMGHSDINLTRQIYTHIRNERKQETANKLNAFNF